MSSTKTAGSTGFGDRFLTAVERAGNKLPQPFNLFLILFLITGVVSTGLALGQRHRRGAGQRRPDRDQGTVHRRGVGLVHHQHRCELHRLPTAGHRRHDPARDRDRGEDRLPVRGDPYVDRCGAAVAAAVCRRLHRGGRFDHGGLVVRGDPATRRDGLQGGRAPSDGRPAGRVRRGRSRLLHEHLPDVPRRAVRGHHHCGDSDRAGPRAARGAGEPPVELLLQRGLLDRAGRDRRLHHRQGAGAEDEPARRAARRGGRGLRRPGGRLDQSGGPGARDGRRG